MASEWALGKAAQAWCERTTSGKVMDPALAEVFAEILDKVANVAEYLHGVVCNVSHGDWGKQSPEWQESARKAVDGFGKMIGWVGREARAGVIVSRPAYGIPNAICTGWNDNPQPVSEILANLSKMIEDEKARKGYDRGPDVVVVHRDYAGSLFAQVGNTTHYVVGGHLFGIPVYMVDSNPEGVSLARELEAAGKRVAVIGRLNAADWNVPTRAECEEAWDTPIGPDPSMARIHPATCELVSPPPGLEWMKGLKIFRNAAGKYEAADKAEYERRKAVAEGTTVPMPVFAAWRDDMTKFVALGRTATVNSQPATGEPEADEPIIR